MEEWKAIREFPGYGVSNQGRVWKTRVPAIYDGPIELTQSPTAHGELTVGLMKDRKQYRRSVKGLVARAFVPGEDEIFDTPILKDGDRTNLWADNMVWRPRWFALAYIKQFDEPSQSWWYAGPLLDITTGYVHADIVSAAIRTGCLIADIRLSMLNKDAVFPTGSIFRWC